MLINMNVAADLVGVAYRTLYRYTYPRPGKNEPARLDRHPQGDYWAVDSKDLVSIFPSRAYLVDRHVRQTEENTWHFLEDKLNEAVESKDWTLASNITETLKTLKTDAPVAI